MKSELFMQMLSIIGSGAVSLMFWWFIVHMKYNFWEIFLRTVVYRDMKPIHWLSDNAEYIGFALIFLGHIFSMIGLLQQLGTGQFMNKPTSFFFSSPLNNAGLMLFGVVYAERVYKNHVSAKN